MFQCLLRRALLVFWSVAVLLNLVFWNLSVNFVCARKITKNWIWVNVLFYLVSIVLILFGINSIAFKFFFHEVMFIRVPSFPDRRALFVCGVWKKNYDLSIVSSDRSKGKWHLQLGCTRLPLRHEECLFTISLLAKTASPNSIFWNAWRKVQASNSCPAATRLTSRLSRWQIIFSSTPTMSFAVSRRWRRRTSPSICMEKFILGLGSLGRLILAMWKSSNG